MICLARRNQTGGSVSKPDLTSAIHGIRMDLPSRYILTGSIREFLFFSEQADKKPAWFSPILNKSDVARIPINSVVILYGTYHKSPLYPIIQQAWEENLISTKVILPDEVTTEHNKRR
jgi:hypothetical protein